MIDLKCALNKAKWGMVEHLGVMKEMNLPLPASNPDPTVIIKNEKQLTPAA
jgi:hypothetical protein